MKKLFFLFATLAIAISAIAQDIIVTKDSKKLEAKITEVSKSEIKYKEFEYQDGPTFILGTDEIVTIIYANGKVELYNQPKEVERHDPDTSGYKQHEVEAIAKANHFGNLFGKTDGTGNGIGVGKKGSPVGVGSQGAGSWSLDGRGIKGTLPMPSKDFKQEGRVVVQIRVNPAGNVVAAAVVGGDVTDKQTQQLALDAAKKAKFTEGDTETIGTITYIFKLN